MEQTSQLLTEAQAAELLQMKAQTLNKWRMRGRGPRYLKLSKKIRYDRADVAAWIAKNAVDPEKQTTKRRRRSAK
jgi:predicted DNA-binding transcriptional regulator AlpA